MRAKSEYWTMKLSLEEMAWYDLLAKIRQITPAERVELLREIELTAIEIDKLRRHAA